MWTFQANGEPNPLAKTERSITKLSARGHASGALAAEERPGDLGWAIEHPMVLCTQQAGVRTGCA